MSLSDVVWRPDPAAASKTRIARFMARPWGPPNAASHAITRLMAGGCAKS